VASSIPAWTGRRWTLSGQYPTNPLLKFEMKYFYEGVAWKLIGFSLEAR